MKEKSRMEECIEGDEERRIGEEENAGKGRRVERGSKEEAGL
jgi:hypothetical protein